MPGMKGIYRLNPDLVGNIIGILIGLMLLTPVYNFINSTLADSSAVLKLLL